MSKGAGMNTVLVTGGAGYIGSHICVELAEQGLEPIIFDNFSNSDKSMIAKLEQIIHRPIRVITADVRNQDLLTEALDTFKCQAVIHLAGLKAVGESVKYPLHYYDNNVLGTIHLIRAMQATGVKTMVFSSSATVYGNPVTPCLDETHPLGAVNPYGKTKLVAEEILRDLSASDDSWRIGILRYFNPVGAHVSGLIGEMPQGVPNNLMPFVADVAAGKRSHINIWGRDYPTQDGTGIRDYIHVCDLAKGHTLSLQKLTEIPYFAVNLGTGRGYSVLEVVKMFEHVSSKKLPYIFRDRRAGDVAEYYANPALAAQLLSWESKRDLLAMCTDHWRFRCTQKQE
jgi:UDP-glucose 4-epimerase